MCVSAFCVFVKQLIVKFQESTQAAPVIAAIGRIAAAAQVDLLYSQSGKRQRALYIAYTL